MERPPSQQKGPGNTMRQLAMATELPFLIVGSTVIAGLLGYLLDGWWHTKPWLMLALGAVGFAAGIREMLRRVDKEDTGARSG